MEVRLTLQELAEIGNHGFPHVSCYGYRGDQVEHGRKWQEMAGNGRKWQEMGCRGYLVGNGFPRVLRHGHRGSPVDNGQNGRKMAEKSSPRLFGRKWISACFTSR